MKIEPRENSPQGLRKSHRRADADRNREIFQPRGALTRNTARLARILSEARTLRPSPSPAPTWNIGAIPTKDFVLGAPIQDIWF